MICKRNLIQIRTANPESKKISVYAMMTKGVMSVLLCSFLFWWVSIELFSTIEGAEPVYDYSEFLRNELQYDPLMPGERSINEKKFIISIQQGYYFNEHLISQITWQDSIITADLAAYYRDSIREASISFDYQENHKISLDFYNWEHKEDLDFVALRLDNSFDLYETEERLISLNNRLRYLFDHDSELTGEEDGLNSLSMSGDLSFYMFKQALSFSYHLPDRHEMERFRLKGVYYRIWNSFLAGAGISYSRDDSTNLFPVIIARYHHKNRFIIRLIMEEYLVEFPLINHFQGNRLFWKSSLTGEETDLEPHLARKVKIGADLFAFDLLQKLSLEYERSEKFHDYYWFPDEDDDPVYSFRMNDNDREQFILKYSASYSRSKLSFSYNSLDRLDFEPLFSASLEQGIKCSIFNEIRVVLDYHYQETIRSYPFHSAESETDNYLKVHLSYIHTGFRNLTLKSSVSYSTLGLSNSYIDIKPEIYLRINYGSANHESLY